MGPVGSSAYNYSQTVLEPRLGATLDPQCVEEGQFFNRRVNLLSKEGRGQGGRDVGQMSTTDKLCKCKQKTTNETRAVIEMCIYYHKSTDKGVT